MGWQDLIDRTATKPTPDNMTLLSDNGISIVYRADDGFIYKHSIPFLINNEFAFLQTLYPTGFVPDSELHDKYTLKIEDLGVGEPVTDVSKFIKYCERLLHIFKVAGVRHGDLTRPHIIVKNNMPKVIDWAESRWWCDKAEDKRPRGDKFWLWLTVREIEKEAS